MNLLARQREPHHCAVGLIRVERGAVADLERQLHPYLASFALVAAYWIQQMVILHYVRFVDRIFVWLNVLFLLPLSLLPFLTDLRVAHPTALPVAILFGGTQLLCSILLLWIWRYATNGGRLTGAPVDPAVVRSMGIRIALGSLLCLAGAAVALKSPRTATVFYVCVPFLYVSHRKVDEGWQALEPDAGAGDP